MNLQLLCKDPSPEIAREKTLSILNKLSIYSWHFKIVLTLSAFATKFGVQLRQLDNKLSESSELDHSQNCKQEVTELKALMNDTLQLIETILDQFEMPSYFGETPLKSITFWIILTIIACATKLTILTSEE